MEERETLDRLAADDSGSVALDGDQSHSFEVAESDIGAADSVEAAAQRKRE